MLGHWDNLWEVSWRKVWKGGRGGKGRCELPDKDREAWEVDWWGDGKPNCQQLHRRDVSGILHLFSGVPSPLLPSIPFPSAPLHPSRFCRLGGQGWAVSLGPTFWTHSMVAVLELGLSGLVLRAVTQAAFC